MFQRVYLTYNPNVLQDGYFSQLQRQLAIYSVAKRFKFSYYHTLVSNVTITPLDPYQTKNESNDFTSRYNKIYNFRGDFNAVSFAKVIEIDSPNLLQIYWEGFKSFFSRKTILIKIVLPYRIIERIPEIYSYAVRDLKPKVDSSKKIKHYPSENKPSIVMHIRKGCLESHITPGENAPRALSTSYFIGVLRHIMISKSFSKSISLIILTDAPESDFYYEPITEQKHLWNQFEYLEVKSKIKVSGHNFKEITEIYPGEVKIIRGGDAHQAVSIMKEATHLVMSRSSMSYVGALLNSKGRIYYPPNFWHKPLKSWIQVAKLLPLI